MRRLVMSAIVVWAGSTGGVAAQGMEWVYTPGRSTPGGASSVSLDYGVAYTDIVQFSLACDSGPGGAMADVDFFTEIGALPDGAPTQVLISAPGQVGVQVAGRVFDDRDLTGQTGARASLPLTHPFFAALGGWSSMSIHLPGQRGFDLPIQRGRADIARFLAACQATVPGGPAAPAPATQADCSSYGSARSVSGDVPQQVTFSNTADAARVLFWIDYQGQPTQIAILEPGLWVTIDTYLTHPWLITDMTGTCQQVMHPQAGQDRFEILR